MRSPRLSGTWTLFERIDHRGAFWLAGFRGFSPGYEPFPATIFGFCHRRLLVPSTLDSPSNAGFAYAKPIGPVFHAHGFAVRGNHVVPAMIPGLFALCGPTAIFGAVVAVVVDAIYRVLGGWANSHVAQELLKRSPLLGDTDASSSVVLETAGGLDGAPRNDAFPYAVSARPGLFVGSHSRAGTCRLETAA